MSTENAKRNTTIQLLLRVREGDQKAFLDLLAEYEPLIGAQVTSHARELSHADAEDMRQVALLALYRAALGFDLEQQEVEFGLWAKICIGNALASQLRTVRRRPTVVEYNERNVTDVATSPADPLIEAEAAEALYARVRRVLSPYENRVWSLYMAGYRAGEIAEQLGKDAHSVENAVYRIRRKLRAALGD